MIPALLSVGCVLAYYLHFWCGQGTPYVSPGMHVSYVFTRVSYLLRSVLVGFLHFYLHI